MPLKIKPCHLRAAREYVSRYHRHSIPPVGGKFAVACYDGDNLCGVAICGRPVARYLDDGLTLEILRCCTDALPDRDSITEDNRAAAEAQLAAIDEAKAELTDEEAAQLDTSRYETAATTLTDQPETDGLMPLETTIRFMTGWRNRASAATRL